MSLARVLPVGKKASASASDGMADMTALAIPAAAAISSNCENELISGISYDGGYAEYMVAPVEAVAAMPESLDAAEAAPLLCAGITTFNALRHSGAFPGDLVAVQGIGGLGHLGIQFANKFGYRAVAIGRGAENTSLAKKLGAAEYIDSQAIQCRTRAEKNGWRTGYSCHRAQLQSDVRTYRRTRSQRFPGSCRRYHGSRLR